MNKITAERYHDISAGHRVVGHENKCRHLHGHNYRFHFIVEAKEMDEIGRVMDFGVIKSKLCMWLEDNWDHKTLLWVKDPKMKKLRKLFKGSIVVTEFNPTAENMARYMIDIIGPIQLKDTGCRLIECKIEETRKCSASAKIEE